MLWIAAIVVSAVVGFGLALVMLSQRRPELGPIDGHLRSCPDSPNCVCSFDDDHRHGIAPLKADTDPKGTMNRLRNFLSAQQGVHIVVDDGVYIHAEFTTPVLRFVDDVEFLLDEAGSVIHVRSASRVGRSDLGVNKNRVEKFRRHLAGEGI